MILLQEALLEQLEALGREFRQEVRFMRTCRHPNLVFFFGAGTHDGVPFLVTEFMARGSLARLLRSDPVELTDAMRVRFALDASRGMQFLHELSPPRVHRDLKVRIECVGE